MPRRGPGEPTQLGPSRPRASWLVRVRHRASRPPRRRALVPARRRERADARRGGEIGAFRGKPSRRAAGSPHDALGPRWFDEAIHSQPRGLTRRTPTSTSTGIKARASCADLDGQPQPRARASHQTSSLKCVRDVDADPRSVSNRARQERAAHADASNDGPACRAACAVAPQPSEPAKAHIKSD